MAISNEVVSVMAAMGANPSADSITIRDIRESYGIARGHMFQLAHIARNTDKYSMYRRWRIEEALERRRWANVLRRASDDFMRGVAHG